jgi:hypothetical protein
LSQSLVRKKEALTPSPSSRIDDRQEMTYQMQERLLIGDEWESGFVFVTMKVTPLDLRPVARVFSRSVEPLVSARGAFVAFDTCASLLDGAECSLARRDRNAGHTDILLDDEHGLARLLVLKKEAATRMDGPLRASVGKLTVRLAV